jgi:hypothetical protein
MMKNFSLRGFLGVALCALLANGCGEEAAKKGTNSSIDPSKGDGDSDGDGDGDGDSQDDPSDPSEEFPDLDDAGDGADGGTSNDAGSDPSIGKPGVTTPGTAGPLLDLPYGGEQLSACYGDECKGDDLLCFANSGTAPGFCTEDCNEDSDCKPIDGLKAECSPERRCQVDCTGSGKGDAKCPKNMECRDLPNPMGGGIVTPIVTDALVSNWRCVYPVDAGKNDVKVYGQCDRDHGHGDCEGTRLCHTPTAPLTLATGPGYCSPSCKAVADCVAPSGTTALPLCNDGACDFDCSGKGASCPQGMNCLDVDNSLLSQTFRCRFID